MVWELFHYFTGEPCLSRSLPSPRPCHHAPPPALQDPRGPPDAGTLRFGVTLVLVVRAVHRPPPMTPPLGPAAASVLRPHTSPKHVHGKEGVVSVS